MKSFKMKSFKMKSFKNKKLNNGGFSLIEVLIAMAILAVLSMPILSNFSSAAKANLLARRTENANTIAQKVAENFKSVNLGDLLNNDEFGVEAGRNYTIDPAVTSNETAIKLGIHDYRVEMIEQHDPSTGDLLASSDYNYDPNLKRYTFNLTDYNGNVALLDNAETPRPFMHGLNEEDFYVKVILDPSDYSDNVATNLDGNSNIGGNNANSYIVPSFQDIDMQNNFIINEEITKYDNQALRLLGVSQANRSSVKKKVYIKAELTKVSETRYTQSLHMDVTYTSDAGASKSYHFEIQKNLEVPLFPGFEPTKNVYIVYNSFDNEDEFSDDEIEIEYVYPSDYWTRDNVNERISMALKVFLIEQDSTTKLDKDNISIKLNGTAADFGRTHNDTIFMNGGPVCVYSNVKDWDVNSFDSSVNYNNITDMYEIGEVLVGQKLYTMTILVYFEKPDDENSLICRVTSTKEN